MKQPKKPIEIRVKIIRERENIIKCFMGKIPKTQSRTLASIAVFLQQKRG